ncbi:hypothetical protein AWB74_07666 [Caballeronia arvi]|uniref:Uncharacterized protein n=1 Tax=Caballeronia arvi TaxID=1777135 RepID=A0A158L022_9BURK|nr:hypothetical protein AWB74_07666 [Caballeronia arvi]
MSAVPPRVAERRAGNRGNLHAEPSLRLGQAADDGTLSIAERLAITESGTAHYLPIYSARLFRTFWAVGVLLM